MSLTLTKWWEAFGDALDRLAEKVTNHQTPQLIAARTMIASGLCIESNLSKALAHKATIERAVRELNANGEDELPSIQNPEELLFAVVYLEHLNRYQNIDTGNFFILRGVKQERAKVADAASRLKARIDAYCLDNTDQLIVAFPEVNEQIEDSWLSKLSHWLKKPSLEEKITANLNSKLSLLLKQHAEDEEIESLCQEVLATLTKQETLLRQSAAYQRLIELLHEHPEDLLSSPENGITYLQTNAPQCIGAWEALHNEVKSHASFKNAARYGAHSLAHIFNYPLNAANRLTQKIGLNRLIPHSARQALSKGASFAQSFTKSLMPISPQEAEKQSLQAQAKNKIASLANELGIEIEAQDFQEKTAAELNSFADKMCLLKRLVSLQVGLFTYQKAHNIGIVRFSQLPVFAVFTELFSMSFLRTLLHHEVCLTQEALRLKKAASQLQERAQKATQAEEIKTLEGELFQALTTTKTITAQLGQERHLFFNQDNKRQSVSQLQELVDEVQILGSALAA